MRLMRTLGLVAVVVAAMATVEAGSAMAVTQLEKVVWCQTNALQTCPAGKDYPAGSEVFAGGNNVEFLSNIGNVTCAGSEFNMTNTALLVHGNVTIVEFFQCKDPKIGECTVMAENLEYLFKGQLMSDDQKYKVEFTEKGANGPLKLTVKCGMGIECTYTSKSLFMEARLSFTPERLIVLQEFIFSKGTFCAKNITWEGTYNPICRAEEGSEISNCWVKMENTP